MASEGETEKNFSMRHILQKHEEQLMDFDKNLCLLCKRSFKSGDQITRHKSLSELHRSRLKRLKKRIFTEEQLDRLERKEREKQYRDRAQERRQKYRHPDRIIPLEPFFQSPSDVIPSVLNARIEPTRQVIKESKGAALMNKMGWREGAGLGKSGDGIKETIKIESQVGTSGLGSKNYKVDPSLSYKEAVKQVMYQRYHEISSDEEAIS